MYNTTCIGVLNLGYLVTLLRTREYMYMWIWSNPFLSLLDNHPWATRGDLSEEIATYHNTCTHVMCIHTYIHRFAMLLHMVSRVWC